MRARKPPPCRCFRSDTEPASVTAAMGFAPSLRSHRWALHSVHLRIAALLRCGVDLQDMRGARAGSCADHAWPVGRDLGGGALVQAAVGDERVDVAELAEPDQVVDAGLRVV